MKLKLDENLPARLAHILAHQEDGSLEAQAHWDVNGTVDDFNLKL